MSQRVALPALFVLACAALVGQSSLPAPESVLGFRVGADFKLATYEQSIEYFRKLDAASDRLTLVEVGRTSLGRPFEVALVSSPSNLAGVEKYREIAVRLASPEGLTDDEARQLARDGKAFVHIDGGLHATEVAGAQHTIQLAYDLVTRAADPKIAAILDNVVLMLWPSHQSGWAEHRRGLVSLERRHAVRGGAAARAVPEVRRPRQQSRRVHAQHDRVARGRRAPGAEWEPQIIYVHHQSSPFPTRIWLPPFAEPIATQVPPIMSRTVNMIGMAIARSLEERGQVGRDAHGHRLRRVVSRLHRLPADAPEHQRVLDRDGALPLRDAASLHDRRLPA